PRQLRVVRVVYRPRRKRLAAAGDSRAPTRPLAPKLRSRSSCDRRIHTALTAISTSVDELCTPCGGPRALLNRPDGSSASVKRYFATFPQGSKSIPHVFRRRGRCNALKIISTSRTARRGCRWNGRAGFARLDHNDRPSGCAAIGPTASGPDDRGPNDYHD